MLRLLAAAACCALLGGGVAGSTAPSPRETLERAAVELLPPGAAVGRIDYRPHCYDFVRPEPTPPCLSVHFAAAGDPDARAGAVRRKVGERWRLTGRRHEDGWTLDLRRGIVHADVHFGSAAWRDRCATLRVIVSCEDSLKVSLGPPLRLDLDFSGLEWREPYREVPQPTWTLVTTGLP